MNFHQKIFLLGLTLAVVGDFTSLLNSMRIGNEFGQHNAGLIIPGANCNAAVTRPVILGLYRYILRELQKAFKTDLKDEVVDATKAIVEGLDRMEENIDEKPTTNKGNVETEAGLAKNDVGKWSPAKPSVKGVRVSEDMTDVDKRLNLMAKNTNTPNQAQAKRNRKGSRNGSPRPTTRPGLKGTEHTKNIRKSTKEKHQKGLSRRQKDQRRKEKYLSSKPKQKRKKKRNRRRKKTLD